MQISAVNHLSLVVSDLEKSRAFYEGVMGLVSHRNEGWFYLIPGKMMLHLIEIEETPVPPEAEYHHYYRHNAVEVSSIADVAKKAIDLGIPVFQMDENGEEQAIVSPDLDFGLKTVFLRDPDGNLWEFIQQGVSWSALWEGLK